jgi:hypothetical protein
MFGTAVHSTNPYGKLFQITVDARNGPSQLHIHPLYLHKMFAFMY